MQERLVISLCIWNTNNLSIWVKQSGTRDLELAYKMKRKGREARGSSPVLFSHSGSSHPTGSISSQKGEGWSPFQCSDSCSAADLSARCWSQGICCSGKPETLEQSSESQTATAFAGGSEILQAWCCLRGDWHDADGQQANSFQKPDLSQHYKFLCSSSSWGLLHCSLPSDSLRYHMPIKQRISACRLLTQPMLDTTVSQIQMCASNKTRPWALPHTQKEEDSSVM